MRYLLDTHTLLWFLQDDPLLPESVAACIEDARARSFVSMASLWEIAIKVSLGKLRVPYTVHPELERILAQNGFETIAIGSTHLQRITELPFHHRDPFDRILVAQATLENLTLLSKDTAFDRYGVPRVWG